MKNILFFHGFAQKTMCPGITKFGNKFTITLSEITTVRFFTSVAANKAMKTNNNFTSWT